MCYHMSGRCKAAASTPEGVCVFSSHSIHHFSFAAGNDQSDFYWEEQSCQKRSCGRDPEHRCDDNFDDWSGQGVTVCANLYERSTPPNGLVCRHTHATDYTPDDVFPTVADTIENG